MIENDFPVHPNTDGTSWAEALAVESWPISENGTPYDIYFEAGRYQDSISFEKFDGTIITLIGRPGVPSGYVVAYGPCGAFWADNFRCGAGGDGGIAEGMIMQTDNAHLFITGTIDDSLAIINSENISPPGTSLNGYTLLSNNIEKGFVAALDRETGEVDWIYYGSSIGSETNRFHHIDKYYEYLAIAGEYTADYTGATSAVSLTSAGSGDEDMMLLLLDTNGAEINAGTIGANEDDHGDAVSLAGEFENTVDWVIHAVLIGDVSGATGSNPVVPLFNDTIGTTNVPLADGTDVLLAHYEIPYGGASMLPEDLRVFHGEDDDHGMDVRITEVGPADVGGHYPNEVVFCGQFESEIDTSGTGNMALALGGSGDIDGFVSATDIHLDIIPWFSPEGSVLGDDESFNALEIQDTIVYGVGKFQYAPTTGLLGNGGFTIGFYTGLFNVQFEIDATYLSVDMALPQGSGTNEHCDIVMLDTSLISSGYVGNSTGFMTFISLNDFEVLSGNMDAFIARINMNTTEYFKKNDIELEEEAEMEEAILYPNPNNGQFDVIFSDRITADIAVYSSMGQRISNHRVNSSAKFHYQQSLPLGIYLVVIRGENLNKTIPFVIQ